MPTVAIIGAGCAGMAAAWALTRSGARCTVFEKSRGLSGRAATRRRDGACYDHGANFFRTEDPKIHDLIHHQLSTDDLVEIPGPVWTFDRSGRPQPGDEEHNAQPKFTYRNGISTLGKLLAASSGATVHRETLISQLSRDGDEWRLTDDDGREHGPFSDVLLTPPAPQTAALINTITGAEELLYPLRTALGACPYHSQFSFILGFDRRIERPDPFHALVNTDRQHPVSWVSFEDDKPGHVPADRSMVILQMSPAWSATHYDTPPEQLLPLVLLPLASLLPPLPKLDWWDSQRWRYAHPERPLDHDTLEGPASLRLFLAGDVLAGKGRVPLALTSGLEIAERILS